MKLSIADKLSLIYTSAGSLRKVAAIAGLSHQQVSRILHKSAQGQSIAAYEKRADIVESVEVAFEIHSDIARGVAKRHKIPFSGEIPVLAERLPLKHKAVVINGEVVFTGSPEYCKNYIDENGLEDEAQIKSMLGERVGALHLHWLSDKLRNAWIAKTKQTGKYYAATVGSVVNLRLYSKTAESRFKEKAKRGRRRNETEIKGKESIKAHIAEGNRQQRVFTPIVSMDKKANTESVLANINDLLESRHAPAIGESGTQYADQVILQLDTRKNAANKQTKRDNRK